MVSFSERIRAAGSAEGEELWDALRTQHPEVLFSATENRNLNEDMALFIVKSRAAPAEALGVLAGDARFKGSYKIKLALAKNPRTPNRISLSLLKYLRVFDMADLTRNHHISAVLRQKAELSLMEKVPAMPSGVKIALSRRSSQRVLEVIMDRADGKVMGACLESPRLTEQHLYRLLLRQTTKPIIAKAVAGHPAWSLRYSIRLALIRNFHTPMERVEAFIRDMKGRDLKDLYADPGLPRATRPFIYQELMRRGESVEPGEDVTYELPEDGEGELRLDAEEETLDNDDL